MNDADLIAPAHRHASDRATTLIRRVTRSTTAEHAAFVVGASVIGQAALVLSAPFLARLYSPHDFAQLALLLSVSTIIGSVASLCLHIPILMERHPRIAAACFRLSVYAALATSFVITPLAIAALAACGAFANPPLWGYGAIAFGIFFVSLYTTFNQVESRFSRYRQIAVAKINNTIAPSIAQIALAFTPLAHNGLVLGRVLGQAVTSATTTRHLPREFGLAALKNPRSPELALAVKRHGDSILHLPRILLVRASANLTPLLMLAAYGPIAAGQLFFAERLVERPGLLLSDALVQIPYKQLADRANQRVPLLPSILRYTACIAALVIPAVAALAIVSPFVFSVVFGPAWTGAGAYVGPLAFMVGARLMSLPAQPVIAIMKTHKSSLLLEAAFFLRLAIIPGAAAFHVTPLQGVWLFCCVSTAYSLATFWLSLSAARRHDLALPGDAQ